MRPGASAALSARRKTEWPTIGLIIVCHCSIVASAALMEHAWPLAFPVLVASLTLYSSLQHEVLHGHPFANRHLNHLLVFPAWGLFVPYLRFQATHLAHHRDANLTDPYDDPESWYLAQRDWARTSWPRQLLLRVNNTLAGRLALGPAISLWAFAARDLAAIRRGDRAIRSAWLVHAGAVVLAAGILRATGTTPVSAYLLAAYLGMSVLMVRTFAEHQAHVSSRGRSVIIESRGLFALLFLNNNLHAVHHAAPDLPWYALPARYHARRAHYAMLNRGYVLAGYGELFRRYAFRAKEPVPHPFVEGERDPAHRGHEA